jgi:hypothetical protein
MRMLMFVIARDGTAHKNNFKRARYAVFCSASPSSSFIKSRILNF